MGLVSRNFRYSSLDYAKSHVVKMTVLHKNHIVYGLFHLQDLCFALPCLALPRLTLPFFT